MFLSSDSAERTPSKLRPIRQDLFNKAQDVMARLIREGPFLRFQVSRSMQAAVVAPLRETKNDAALLQKSHKLTVWVFIKAAEIQRT